MKIAITGHRPNKLWGDYDLTSKAVQNIKTEILAILAVHEPDFLISGMALGIDTLFAQIAIEECIPLIAAIPFKGQENRWIPKSINKYFDILNMANVIMVVNTGSVYTSLKSFTEKEPVGTFSNKAMQDRNEWMVDNCDLLIAVWDGTSGGTGNCVKYAQGKKPVAHINPHTLEVKHLVLG